MKEFGCIDILVNNAGHFGERLGLPFTNQTEEEWDDNYTINVKGPFFLCKAVAPHMMERPFRGKSSTSPRSPPKRDPQIVPAYAAGKNALLTLTRIVAKDLAPYNINVNAICPGMVWGHFWKRLAPLVAAGEPSFAGMEPRELFEAWFRKSTPLQREQTPEDIGNPGRLSGLGRSPKHHRPDHPRGWRRSHELRTRDPTGPAAGDSGQWLVVSDQSGHGSEPPRRRHRRASKKARLMGRERLDPTRPLILSILYLLGSR